MLYILILKIKIFAFLKPSIENNKKVDFQDQLCSINIGEKFLFLKHLVVSKKYHKLIFKN